MVNFIPENIDDALNLQLEVKYALAQKMPVNTIRTIPVLLVLRLWFIKAQLNAWIAIALVKSVGSLGGKKGEQRAENLFFIPNKTTFDATTNQIRNMPKKLFGGNRM